MVDYHPISAKDKSRLHHFGSEVLPGIFLGYAEKAEGIWKGDIMVADIEELEEMDASELHANSKEVLINAAKKWKLHFLSRRCNSQNLWERTASEKTTLTRERPERGEEQEIRQGNSDEWNTPSHLQEYSTRDDEKAKIDFWTITG